MTDMNDEYNDYDEIEEIELPLVYKLRYPVITGKGEKEKTTETVTFRRLPLALDFKGIRTADLKSDDMVKILSRLLEVPVLVVERMKAWDFIKLQGVLTNFLPENG